MDAGLLLLFSSCAIAGLAWPHCGTELPGPLSVFVSLGFDVCEAPCFAPLILCLSIVDVLFIAE